MVSEAFKRKWAEIHSEKVLLRLENDLFPWLGSRLVASIDASELLEAIRRIESRGALDAAHRCLGYPEPGISLRHRNCPSEAQSGFGPTRCSAAG